MEQMEEMLASIERREATLRADRMRFELGAALSEAKCRPDAIQDALGVMLGSCAVEMDNDGRATKFTIGDQSYATPLEAAQAFVSKREYLHDKASADSRKSSTERAAPSPASVVAEAWARPEDRRHAVRSALPSANLEDLLKAGHSAGDLASEGWATPPK